MTDDLTPPHWGTQVQNLGIGSPFWHAMETALTQPDLFQRMQILYDGAQAQLQQFEGLPDTPHTHYLIEACRDEMARAIVVRNLLGSHGKPYV